MIKLLPLSVIIIFMSGCFGGLSRKEVVAAPNAPLYILEGKGWVRVASHDPTTNSLVFVGKIPLQDLQGRTITNFDWSEELKNAR